jgi:stage II sporulation protein D
MTAAVLLAALVGCASARAAGVEEVRVLVYDEAASVRIGPSSSPHRVELRDGGLVVDGRAVGSHWVPEGRAPWRVGSRLVRGRVAVRAHSGHVQVLNRVGLEDYVASTVGGEMSPSWPTEALRAQAVAARTYVLHEAAKRRDQDWDVLATTASQVYRGIDAETDETRSAARATQGEVLIYRGEPILAVFHSTAGGRTATAAEVWGEDRPYLRSVEVDEEDDAPHTYWRTQFGREDLARVLSTAGLRIDAVEGLAVTRRTRSGRVERLEIRGPGRREELRGQALRDLISSLGLRSTLFDIRGTAEGWAFVGSGYGHGVGMSQWGARAMAERGDAYPRILARFYPGTRLARWSTRRVATPHVSAGGHRDTQAGRSAIRGGAR